MHLQRDDILDIEASQHIPYHHRQITGGKVPTEGLLLPTDEELSQDLAAVVSVRDMVGPCVYCI